ncbi:MAG: ABC transporter substrate-binding protein [Bacillota bacterium]|nr:ABC transporter substrate-binding protein [Bacillota bacterium]
MSKNTCKVFSILLAGVVLISSLTACGSGNTGTTTAATTGTTLAQSQSSENTTTTEATTVATTTTTEMAKNPENEKFVLEYPADMQEKGFKEPLVLEKRPQRVVCLTASPVLALYEMGVNMVGIPKSRIIKWPEELVNNVEIIPFSPMSPEDFDFESLVVLEPDLVILTSGSKDSAGKKITEEFKIPVYYLMGGHSVKYSSVKLQTEQLVKAFGTGDAEEKGKALMKRFDDLEAKIAKVKDSFKGIKVMVLASSGDKHFIQPKGGTLGSMLDMLGFENVFQNEKNSMVQLDMEQALSYEPDYVVCAGGGTPEQHKELMQKVFAENPDYWHTISAIKEGKVLYLGVEYVPSAGINVIDNISNLVDYMAELTGVKVE